MEKEGLSDEGIMQLLHMSYKFKCTPESLNVFADWSLYEMCLVGSANFSVSIKKPQYSNSSHELAWVLSFRSFIHISVGVHWLNCNFSFCHWLVGELAMAFAFQKCQVPRSQKILLKQAGTHCHTENIINTENPKQGIHNSTLSC